MDRKLTKPDKRPKVRQIASGKRPKAGNKITTPGRVTTFKPNGASSMEAAPEPQPLNLGPIILPSPEDSQRVLKEIAELNDQALQANKVYADLKDRTKAAKEKYDDLAARVILKLQRSTHQSDLPLFDKVEREGDLAKMEAAAAAPAAAPLDLDAMSAADGGPQEPAEAISGADAATDMPSPEIVAQEGAGEAQAGEIPDDQIPF